MSGSLRFLLACWLLSLGSSALADEGASFLAIPQGARAVGLGNAFVTQADPTALWHNAAGLSPLGSRHVTATHTELYADTRVDLLGYVQPLKGLGTVGLGAIHLSQGAIEGRDPSGRMSGNFTASDLSLGLVYAKAIGALTHLGLGIKFIRQNLADSSAAGFALDLGALYHLKVLPVTLGASVQNLGPKMKFVSEPFNLPLNLRAGASHLLLGLVSVGLDFQYRPYDQRRSISFGAEYWPLPQMALRGGYLGILRSASGTPQGFSFKESSALGAGMGFRLGRQLGLDYAFSPQGDLGNSHRFTLGVRW